MTYKRPTIEKGYTNQSLYVNLSKQEISVKPVTEKMKEVFIGGKGFDLWLDVECRQRHHKMERS